VSEASHYYFCEERGKIGDLKARQARIVTNRKGVRVRGRVGSYLSLVKRRGRV